MRAQFVFWPAAAILFANPLIATAQDAAVGKATPPFDTRYITEDFVAAVAASPKRILANPITKAALSELQKAKGKEATARGIAKIQQEWGVPIRQTRQFLFLFDRDFAKRVFAPERIGGSIGPTPVLIVRYDTPADQRAELKRYVGDPQADAKQKNGRPKRPEKMTHAGNTYYRKPYAVRLYRDGVQGGELGACFVDDKTLIVADERHLKRMLTAKNVDTPLTRRLKTLESGADVVAVATKPAIAAAMKTLQLDTLPPGVSQLLKTVENAESLAFAARLTGEPLLSAIAETVDEKSAVALSGLFDNNLLPMFKASAKRESAAMNRQRGAPAAVKAMFAALSDSIEALRTTRSKREVVVSMPRPKRVEDYPKFFVPAILAARLREQRAARRIRLMKVGLALLYYEGAHRRFPGAGSDAKGKHTGLSWRVHLLPHLKQKKLYARFKLDEPWDSPHNKRLIAEMPAEFKSLGVEQAGKTSIHVFVGKKAPFPTTGPGPRFRDIQDDVESTLMAIEAGPDKADFWTKPGGIPFALEKKREDLLGKITGKSFPGLFFDGRVRWLSKNIDVSILRLVIQHNDGEQLK